MTCMKCGREIEADQAFCSQCLELMAQYPVKPDIVVKLPRHQDDPPKKSPSRKRNRTPEEQIALLKRRNRWLTATTCLLLVISVILAFLSVDFFRQLDMQKLLGQNYSTAETVN